MEENSRHVKLLERQQTEAQSLVDSAKEELDVEKLLKDIERAKLVFKHK